MHFGHSASVARSWSNPQWSHANSSSFAAGGAGGGAFGAIFGFDDTSGVRPGFVAEVARVIREEEIEAGSLELELTEPSLFFDWAPGAPDRYARVLVELADRTRFAVGSGFTDRERSNPPPIGSTIDFTYQELTDGGVPRFPVFLRMRTDLANMNA